MLLAEVIPTGVTAGEGIGLNRGEYGRCWVQLRLLGGFIRNSGGDPDGCALGRTACSTYEV